MGIAAAGAILAAAAVMFIGHAAASTDPASCSFSVSAADAHHVGIGGVAPAGSYVFGFINGKEAATASADSAGRFSIPGVTGSINDVIAVSYSFNPDAVSSPTSCVHVGGTAASGATTPESTPNKSAIAFTGASHVALYVVAGVAAALGGLLLLFIHRARDTNARGTEPTDS